MTKRKSGPGRKPRLPPIIRLPRLPILRQRKADPTPLPQHEETLDTGQMDMFPPEGVETRPEAQGNPGGRAPEPWTFRSIRSQLGGE
jgi:hypothetical protein